MALDAYFCDVGSLAAEGLQADYGQPVVLVDLARLDPAEAARLHHLPPCPVIGIGDAAHPLAARMDVVVAGVPQARGLVANITAQPMAAAVIAELLRLLPGLSVEAGLVAESLAYGMLQGSAEHRGWLAGRSATAPQPSGVLLMERRAEALWAVIDRPWARNEVDRPMRDALDEMFTLVSLDDEIDRVVLCGRGRTFCMGADLAEFGTTSDPATAHAIRRHSLPARLIARVADRFEVRIGGACVGSGLEMAAFASRIVASEAAWFQLPELAMGILPGAGGCVSLTRRIGRQRTAYMILSGKRISAALAHDWGLVDCLVDEAALYEGGGDILG